MEVHPRHKIRNLAHSEAKLKFLEVEKKYDLSYGEMFVILSEQIQSLSYSLRKIEGNYKLIEKE